MLTAIFWLLAGDGDGRDAGEIGREFRDREGAVERVVERLLGGRKHSLWARTVGPARVRSTVAARCSCRRDRASDLGADAVVGAGMERDRVELVEMTKPAGGPKSVGSGRS